MSLAVIPLAITMNAGPQIMSAIIFVTSPKALKLSAYFMAGVVIAVTAGVTITYTLASVLGGSISLGDPSDSGSIGNIIQYVLVGLLVILSIRSYLTRATSEPPRWLGAMQNATPRTAFLAGLLLLSIFPSDFVDSDNGRGEPRAERLQPSRRGAIRRGDHLDSGASGALLPAVSQARPAVNAEGARLDEHQQLAGEHHRLRHLYPAHPLLMTTIPL